MSQEFESFEDFWPFYLQEHSDPTNRALHVAGTLAALATAGYAVASKRPKLLAVAPLMGYGAAWVGHFLIEKNRPATFRHPVWSLRGDLKMAQLAVSGQLEDELKRVGVQPKGIR
ncbi:MAG: DUF962 domain-containing protein [bacterium]